jgi:hypothetical protein
MPLEQCQGVVVQRLSLVEPALGLIETGKVAEAYSDVGMAGRQSRFAKLQGAFRQRNGFSAFADAVKI